MTSTHRDPHTNYSDWSREDGVAKHGDIKTHGKQNNND